MRALSTLILAVALPLLGNPPVGAPDKPATPDAALAELKAGNQRWVEGKRTRTIQVAKDATLRKTLAGGQDPFAVIVCCADSRVDESLIFDQEPGRLFVIREAGNSPDLQGVASIDYGVGHLKNKVVVVMGHSACGAVKAVASSGDKPLPGNLAVFQTSMKGLVESTPKQGEEKDGPYADRLAQANAVRQAQALFAKSEEIAHLAASGAITVVPAYYDLHSGKVTFLPAVKPEGKPEAH